MDGYYVEDVYEGGQGPFDIHQFAPQIDGSLYLCIDGAAIETNQPISYPCSDYLSFYTGTGSLGENCRIHFIHGVTIKVTYSQLLPGDVVDVRNITGRDGNQVGGLTVVVALPGKPERPAPYVQISGTTEVSFVRAPAAEVCWDIAVLGSGLRGEELILSSTSSALEMTMDLKENIFGEPIVCVDADEWEPFVNNQEYTITVTAVSNLFDTSSSASHTFVVRRAGTLLPTPAPSPSNSSCPSLWEFDSNPLYAIRTYPSGNSLLSWQTRDEGLTIQLKALCGCEQTLLARELLGNFSISWRFLNLLGETDLELNQFSQGGNLMLPPSLLKNRTLFPVYSPTPIAVEVEELDGSFSLSTTLTIAFTPGPVDVIGDPPHTIPPTYPLEIDLVESITVDGVRVTDSFANWEWLWRCEFALTGEPCTYESGEELQFGFKENSTHLWEKEEGERFIVGQPMMFVVHAKVTYTAENPHGFSTEAKSVGKWRRVITPVEEGVPLDLELELFEWRCLSNDKNGYFMHIPTSDQFTITSSSFESLWTEETDDFGALQIQNIEGGSGNVELRCTCEEDCSEPLFVRLRLQIEGRDEEVVLYNMVQPHLVLPPSGGSCSVYYDTIDEARGEDEDELVGALSFAVVECGGWEYADGDIGLTPRVHSYEIYDPETGESVNPLSYPRRLTAFGPAQFILPCGNGIRIFSDIVGYGQTASATRHNLLVAEVATSSWTSAHEEAWNSVDYLLQFAHNDFVQNNFVFSTLLSQSTCESPFNFYNKQEIFATILETEPPTTLAEIKNELPILLASIDPTDASFLPPLLTRLRTYLGFINSFGRQETELYPDLYSGVGAGGEEEGRRNVGRLGGPSRRRYLEGSVEVLELVLFSVSEFLGSGVVSQLQADDLLSLFNIVHEIEGSLLCYMSCGADPIVLNSEFLSIGMSFDTLWNLSREPIPGGDSGVVFTLPDVNELAEKLGTVVDEDVCFYSAYSVIKRPGNPFIASFSFFDLNCTTGETTEIPVEDLNSQFLVSLPMPDDFQPSGVFAGTNAGAPETYDEMNLFDGYGTTLGYLVYEEDVDTNSICTEDENPVRFCLSGPSVFEVVQTGHCRIVEETEDSMVCGCSQISSHTFDGRDQCPASDSGVPIGIIAGAVGGAAAILMLGLGVLAYKYWLAPAAYEPEDIECKLRTQRRTMFG
jgi:hypothetical protein